MNFFEEIIKKLHTITSLSRLGVQTICNFKTFHSTFPQDLERLVYLYMYSRVQVALFVNEKNFDPLSSTQTNLQTQLDEMSQIGIPVRSTILVV